MGFQEIVADRVVEETPEQKIARYEATLKAISSSEAVHALGPADFREWVEAAASEAMEGLLPECPRCGTFVHAGACVREAV